MNLPQLRRIRWSVRAVLVLGVAASVCANVLHARRDPVAQIIAGWPPLALLITIELLSRVPVHRRSTGAVRLAAAAAIAAIAAWVSYWHMAAVASRYGETDASPYLLPLSVDGLIVVASVSLVELAGRIRTGEEQPVRTAPVAVPDPRPDGPADPGPDPAPEDVRTAAAEGSGTDVRDDSGPPEPPPSGDTPDPRPEPSGPPSRTPRPDVRKRTSARTRTPSGPRPDGPSGRRPAATADDVRCTVAASNVRLEDLTRETLVQLMRGAGYSVGNDRVAGLLAEVKQPVNGRTPSLASHD